ncbi:hypothetical protein MAR_017468 [Mya arenaria]|uniref:Uncharacterized protein n=1 Tax=Mya arenaria TaxID=6604 RepID=A0ABY7EEL8_MYAAR|nr:hypothetical protein MAR_017468 [Mya arenaria]
MCQLDKKFQGIRWIRDALGNYQSAFHFAGISLIASSFVMGLSTFCVCKRKKKHTKDVEIFSEPSGKVQLVGGLAVNHGTGLASEKT